MSVILYYPILIKLTEDKIIEINKQIYKNRKAICIFVKNIRSNITNITKRLIESFISMQIIVFLG